MYVFIHDHRKTNHKKSILSCADIYPIDPLLNPEEEDHAKCLPIKYEKLLITKNGMGKSVKIKF
jgi:hypothetical protein